MQKFVSLLRGINVGGHKKVPMADLRDVLIKNGFLHVKTLLASGNVVYEADEDKTDQIGIILEKTFGFTIPVITLPFHIMKDMVASDPFASVKVTPKIKFYITFLKSKPNIRFNLPYIAEDDAYQILKVDGNAIFSSVDLEKTGTLEAMAFLEKEFGKDLTTRNYNTVEKIVKL